MNNHLDLVLLDDDELIRTAWQLSAKHHGMNILTFSDHQALMHALDEIPVSTPIYVDQTLKGNLVGEAVAAALHARGYYNLYIETGNFDTAPSHSPLIKGYCSKIPPWLN